MTEAECQFELRNPTGTIISIMEVGWQSPTMVCLREGYYWYEDIVEENVPLDPEWDDITAGPLEVLTDSDGVVYEIVTTDGTFYAVSANCDGHGDLCFFKQKTMIKDEPSEFEITKSWLSDTFDIEGYTEYVVNRVINQGQDMEEVLTELSRDPYLLLVCRLKGWNMIERVTTFRALLLDLLQRAKT